MATNLKWDNVQFRDAISTWDQNPYKWDDIFLILELISDGASAPEIAGFIEDLEPEKKERFIKLVCKVKGIETYSGQKTVKENIKVTAEDVELVVKEVLGIDLTVENIHV